jgi:hypothetical protein
MDAPDGSAHGTGHLLGQAQMTHHATRQWLEEVSLVTSPKLQVLAARLRITLAEFRSARGDNMIKENQDQSHLRGLSRRTMFGISTLANDHFPLG